MKELIDNALDACEEAGAAPEITITVAENYLSVQSQRPRYSRCDCEPHSGLRLSGVVPRSLLRTRPRRTRERLENADSDALRLERRSRRSITLRAGGGRTSSHRAGGSDSPASGHSAPDAPVPHVQTGTFVQIHWPRSATLTAGRLRPNAHLALTFVCFNPHLTLTFRHFAHEEC